MREIDGDVHRGKVDMKDRRSGWWERRRTETLYRQGTGQPAVGRVGAIQGDTEAEILG